MKSIPERR